MQWRTLLFSLFLEYILRFATPYSLFEVFALCNSTFQCSMGKAILYHDANERRVAGATATTDPSQLKIGSVCSDKT